MEATRSEYEGVAYPLVTFKPSASATLSVGQQATFYASLSEPTGNAWTSCCSSYTSSDASVASVSVTGYGVAGAEKAVIVAHKAGNATITATTESGTSGTLSVVVAGGSDPSRSSGGSTSGGTSAGGGSSGSSAGSSASSSSTHEPSGMATQVNTGPITSTGAFSIFSPSTPASWGEWAGNLSTVPGGSGLRMTYRPSLQGGYSPVRFGMPIASAGTGWYYQRMRVRFSPNWTLNGNIGLKFCEPRTYQTGFVQGANENHVISMSDFETNSTHAWLMAFLQGPYGQARDLFEQPQYNPAANLNDGQWRTVEVLFTPESTPGAGNGTYTGWVDGVQIAHYTNVQWLAKGNRAGWPYLMFDPTYGGGSHSPNATMYWDMDELYVSTK